MPDTSVTKVSSLHSPKGEMGQKYLATSPPAHAEGRDQP